MGRPSGAAGRVRPAAGAGLGLLGAALALGLWWGGALDRVENVTWDWRVRVRAAPSEATGRIKLIAIDDPSLRYVREQAHASWPWPRSLYPLLINFCKRGGARSVTFDILFDQPSTVGEDAALGRAIGDGPPFVAAMTLFSDGDAPRPLDAPEAVLPVEGLAEWMATGRPGVRADAAKLPIPEALKPAAAVGSVSQTPDPDGVIRRIRLFRILGDRAVPSLPLAVYRLEHDGPAALAGDHLRVGAASVPLDARGRAILRFRGPAQTYETFSAAGILQSEVELLEGKEPTLDPAVFRGAHVILGITATGGTGGFDIKASPVDSKTPGMEFNATALDNLFADDFLRPAPVAVTALSTLLLAMLAGAGGVALARWWWIALALALCLPLLGLFGIAWYDAGFWWPVTPPALAVLTALAGAAVHNFATEGRQRRFVKTVFGHYLSPVVIDRVLADPDRLTLGGERRTLTIFFSDLQGFTTLSERLEPQALTALLNAYLSDMTDIILEEEGTLDKYEGDAIIAFWNAPLDQPDHALRGVRAAVRCQRRLAERRAAFVEEYGAELHMRIGMHTGEVVVGNMGSRRRFDYTMLGDAANLAARLEGANKTFGTYTMISDATRRIVEAEVRARALGSVRVVGRREPVRVFEPYGFAHEPADPRRTAVEEGVRLVEARDWGAARTAFAAHPDDPVAARYAERLRELSDQPPSEWDGVWNLTAK